MRADAADFGLVGATVETLRRGVAAIAAIVVAIVLGLHAIRKGVRIISAAVMPTLEETICQTYVQTQKCVEKSYATREKESEQSNVQ